MGGVKSELPLIPKWALGPLPGSYMPASLWLRLARLWFPSHFRKPLYLRADSSPKQLFFYGMHTGHGKAPPESFVALSRRQSSSTVDGSHSSSHCRLSVNLPAVLSYIIKKHNVCLFLCFPYGKALQVCKASDAMNNRVLQSMFVVLGVVVITLADLKIQPWSQDQIEGTQELQ